MAKLAIICGGQGTQYSKMDEVWNFDKKTKSERLDLLQRSFKEDLKEVLKSDLINETKFAQPLLVWLQTLIYDEINKLNIPIAATAGFSLGEYASYYVSKILSANETLELVLKRSKFMQEASMKKPGAMVAVLGLDSKEVEEIVSLVYTYDDPIYTANYNTQIQTVVSGTNTAISKFMIVAKEKGAKRVVKLNVSGGFHTPLMQEAAVKLEDYLSTLNLKEPKIPFYLNSTHNKLIFSNLKQEAKKQTMGPVYFQKMIEQMINDGITHFIEIGPQAVLAPMIIKINHNANVITINKQESLTELKEWIKDVQFEK